jgi:hypothetical protein
VIARCRIVIHAPRTHVLPDFVFRPARSTVLRAAPYDGVNFCASTTFSIARCQRWPRNDCVVAARASTPPQSLLLPRRKCFYMGQRHYVKLTEGFISQVSVFSHTEKVRVAI